MFYLLFNANGLYRDRLASKNRVNNLLISFSVFVQKVFDSGIRKAAVIILAKDDVGDIFSRNDMRVAADKSGVCPGWRGTGNIGCGDTQSYRQDFRLLQRSVGRGGFTIIELLAVITIIALLAAMLFPALANSKGRARRVECTSNLKQLSLALILRVDDWDDELPPRAATNWIRLLAPYYIDSRIIRCPTEKSGTPRTYIMNGFNDWFEANLNVLDFLEFMDWRWPHGIRQSAIPDPTDTITFGEKLSSSSHVHCDLLQNNGNDLEEIDQRRHPGGKSGRGSTFSFADGSVRFLGDGDSLYSQNLWAVTPEWRYTYYGGPQ